MMGSKTGKVIARFGPQPGTRAGQAVAKKMVGGRVDAPGPSSTVRQTAMKIMQQRSLQGSSGARLQGSSPSLQLPNNQTRRLQ